VKIKNASSLLSILVGLFAFSLFPTPSRADHWERVVDVGASGETYYIDTESIAIDGSTVKVWERTVLSRPETDSQGRLIFSQKHYKSIGCKQRYWKNIQSIDYADRDSTAVVGEITYYPANWPMNVAKPGSVAEEVMAFVCKAALRKHLDTSR